MTILEFEKTKKLLKDYGIGFAKSEIFTLKKEAVEFAEKIKYPVVLKIHSQSILHKTEKGGVKLSIESKEELSKAWDEITKNVGEKNMEGIIVQKMVSGHQIVLGMKRDKQFGPVVMFGLGGIFVEVVKDVSFRIVPFSKKEAMQMIKETKGYKILKGARGGEKSDISKIVEMISNLSKLSQEREDIKEIDFNPVFATKNSAVVSDAKIII